MLRQVLHALQQQTISTEVICIDDASTDGTPEMLRAEFPEVKVLRHTVSCGPAVARNAGAMVATGDFLLSLDDDCVLAEPDCLERGLLLFDAPEIGGVTLPFVNIRRDRQIRTAAPKPEGTFVTTDFYGGMVILRRDIFLEVGGYREPFFMQHEEADLAIRLIDRHIFIRNGFERSIDHYESPLRDPLKLWRLSAQNAVLFAFYNVPWPWLPCHLTVTMFKTFVYACRRGAGFPTLEGFWASLSIARRTLRMRGPVTSRTYLAFRILKRCGVLPLKRMKELMRPR